MLDNVKNNNKEDFNTEVSQLLMSKLRESIDKYKLSLVEQFTLKDVQYLKELLAFLGFDSIEQITKLSDPPSNN